MSAIATALQTSELVPDVLRAVPEGIKLLHVKYEGLDLTPGQEVPRARVLQQPTLSCSELAVRPAPRVCTLTQTVLQAGNYILLMVDPDLFMKNGALLQPLLRSSSSMNRHRLPRSSPLARKCFGRQRWRHHSHRALPHPSLRL
jgi:hypothetical protein